MKSQITKTGFKLWLSANDTYAWANRAGKAWPGSQLAGHRVFVEYYHGNLEVLSIDGDDDADCDASELNAVVYDHISPKLPKDHPCR